MLRRININEIYDFETYIKNISNGYADVYYNGKKYLYTELLAKIIDENVLGSNVSLNGENSKIKLDNDKITNDIIDKYYDILNNLINEYKISNLSGDGIGREEVTKRDKSAKNNLNKIGGIPEIVTDFSKRPDFFEINENFNFKNLLAVSSRFDLNKYITEDKNYLFFMPMILKLNDEVSINRFNQNLLNSYMLFHFSKCLMNYDTDKYIMDNKINEGFFKKTAKKCLEENGIGSSIPVTGEELEKIKNIYKQIYEENKNNSIKNTEIKKDSSFTDKIKNMFKRK